MSGPKIEWRHPEGRQWYLVVDGRVVANVYDFNDIGGYWQIDYCAPKGKKRLNTLRGVGLLTVQLRALELVGMK